MSMKPPPSLERLKEVLAYNPKTGVFTWKNTLSKRRGAGKEAGSKTNFGYIAIQIDKVRYQAHRLAWFYVYGVWPLNDIDHINLARNDNRIQNLREARRADNLCNTGVFAHNTSGFKGVSWHKVRKTWRATIKHNQRAIHLGNFSTKEEAAEAYRVAAKNLFGDFARFSRDG